MLKIDKKHDLISTTIKSISLKKTHFAAYRTLRGNAPSFHRSRNKIGVKFHSKTILKKINIMLINDCVIKLMVVSWPLSPYLTTIKKNCYRSYKTSGQLSEHANAESK
jgi:hypothetical protein